NGSPHTKSAQFINRKHDVDQPFSSSSVPTTSAAIQQPLNREFYSQGDSSPHTKSAQFINRKHDVDQPFSSSSVPTTSTAIQQPCNRKFYSQGLYKLLKIIDKVQTLTHQVKRKLFDVDGSSDEDDLGIVNTSASPFKVTRTSFFIGSPKTSFDESTLNNKTQNCSFKCEDILVRNINLKNCWNQIVKKTLRVVLKTKYDIETISQKQDQLETVVKNLSFHEKINSQNDYNSQQEVSFEMLPITNEDDLIAFEEKLSSDKTFKSNLISELKRNAKRNLTATVRQLLRTVYDDSLLKDYSFKGQKSKKVFSTLTSCSVIFGKI
ncbi:kinesin-related protein 2-like, partial [Aphis craccivora]